MIDFILPHAQNTFSDGLRFAAIFVIALALYVLFSYITWSYGAFLRDPEEEPSREDRKWGTLAMWTCWLWPLWFVVAVVREIILYACDLYLWLVKKMRKPEEVADEPIDVVFDSLNEVPSSPPVQDAEIVPVESNRAYLHEVPTGKAKKKTTRKKSGNKTGRIRVVR